MSDVAPATAVRRVALEDVAKGQSVVILRPIRRSRQPPGIDPADARQAFDTAHAVLDAARRLLDSGKLDEFV